MYSDTIQPNHYGLERTFGVHLNSNIFRFSDKAIHLQRTCFTRPFQLNSAAQKLCQVFLRSCDFHPRPVLGRQWDILDLMLQAALHWKKSFGNLKNPIFGFDEKGKPVHLEKNDLESKEQTFAASRPETNSGQMAEILCLFYPAPLIFPALL